MRLHEILKETTSAATCAGNIATVAQPVGGMIAREDNPTKKNKYSQTPGKKQNARRKFENSFGD